MESQIKHKRPQSPSDDSEESSFTHSRKYDRSPSLRRRYRRSKSRSCSKTVRSKDITRHNWKSSNLQQNTKSPNPVTGSTSSYTQPLNQYNASLQANTSQLLPQMQAYNSNYGNYNYSYGQNYEYSTYQQQNTNYRNDYSTSNWPGNVTYNSQQQSEVANQDQVRLLESSTNVALPVGRPEEAKKEALAAELKQQKATLAKQREEYLKKSGTLQRELELLRKQCEEIGKESGRDNNRIIKENQKLQIEIQNKMKSIHNVIDMLTGIIGDKIVINTLETKHKEETKRIKSTKSQSPQWNQELGDEKPLYNFVYYDPEMHWCKICDIFPKTAKEYLNHLHSVEHKEMCMDKKIVDVPWHERNKDGVEKEMPFYPGLPTKRTPIKGLQFFSPATAWFCKLCSTWIGDLRCASLHLKSRGHSENYARFMEQNPHWETDWLADREKAFSDDKHKLIQLELQKQKEDSTVKVKKSKKNKKNKKKSKKRKNKSSNSDTSSDSGNSDSENTEHDIPKSIRVTMRNKIKPFEVDSNWSQKCRPNDEKSLEYNTDQNFDKDKIQLRDKEQSKEDHNTPYVKNLCNQEKNTNGQNSYSIHEHQSGWGEKEPKSFWIKKEEEKPLQKIEIPKQDEIPKPHMGFWTKQQVNMVVKHDHKPDTKDDDREKYRDDRKDKYDKYDKHDRYRDDRYDKRRNRDPRERDYYDNRKRRGVGDSPRRCWRESPKRERGYDKYKNREDDSNDELKYGSKKDGDKSKKSRKSSTSSSTRGKLPFIGRLPLFKKKDDPKLPDKEVTPVPYIQTKFEDTPRVPNEIINPPGVVHITKLATPVTLPNSINIIKAQEQMKILIAPPPPEMKQKMEDKNTEQVVDMEIDEQIDETGVETISEVKEKIEKKNPILPNTSLPPPGYTSTHPEKKLSVPAAYTPSGPPPPFVTNSFINAQKFDQSLQSMSSSIPQYLHSVPVPPPLYSNPPPLPPSSSSEPSGIGTVIMESAEKRVDGDPLPDDLQEALNIIFPKGEIESSIKQHDGEEETLMYGSMYSMLGCVGYGPDYMDLPPPEITQQTEMESEDTGPEELAMLGINKEDTII